MKKRFIAAAVPVLVAGSLAATAPSTSQAAGGGRAAKPAPPVASAQASAATAVTPCTGGAQKKAMTGGHADWIWTDSTTTVPGTLQQFRGPQQGKDTVFVTLTAHHTYIGDNGDYARVRVLLDGVDMTPTTSAPEYLYADGNYGSLAGQYCGKVQGGGFHKVRVVLDSYDSDGDGYDGAYLYNPMVHVEVAN